MVVLLATGLATGGVAAQAETVSGRAAAERCVPGDCFAVTAVLDRAPAVGQTATLTVTVTAKEKAADVRVVTDLPGNLRWVSPPDGMSRGPATIGRTRLDRASRTGPMRKNERARYVGTVLATEPGPAAVNVHVSDGRPGPGSEALAYLTVGKETSFFGGARPASTAPPRAVGVAADPDTCVRGRITYLTVGGAIRGVPKIRMNAVGKDDVGGDKILARGLTDDQGDYELCFAGRDVGQGIYVVGHAYNDYWAVADPTTTVTHSFQTPVTPDVEAGTRDTVIDYLSTPGSKAEGWFRIFAAAYDTWKAYTGWAGNPGGCWVAGASPCRPAAIMWAPYDMIPSAYYSTNNDTIYLSAQHQLENMTVAHELGHFIMDYVYADVFPANPSCANHWLEKITSQGCAWTEGWADWVALQTYGETHYRWGPLDPPVDLESPTWNSPGWVVIDGPEVEGRVAGALIDLADDDPRNEIYWDLSSEGPEKIVSVVTATKPNTVVEFKNALLAVVPTPGGKSNVLATLYQNTIDGLFYEPLLDRVELNRPNASYSITTTRPTWSVVAALTVENPANDVNVTMFKSETSAENVSSRLPGSDQPDFIAVDAASGPRSHVAWALGPDATESYLVEFAESEGSLAPRTSTQLSMESADVVEIRTADLTANTPVSFTVTPLDGQDLDVFTMAPNSAKWARPRSDAKGAFGKGPGIAERLTVTPSVTGTYAVIVIQKSGSGRFTLARS
ncbi:hypothetical protein AB0B89_32415 [Sphaerisporangium sp. NPDC049002]|uniref:hypothetical protein n=1 Tax=unclassified Sphaerisporangium TaxID=2630420 RepID=UPI00340DC1BB